jgi:UDP-N-acetylmuramoyl-tripeptide--D-alanyl-D-alanine ligase
MWVLRRETFTVDTTLNHSSETCWPRVELSVGRLHEITGGRLCLADLPPVDREDAPVGRLVTDSRQIEPGDVFWALPGPRHDGADFAVEAAMRGAAGIVAARPFEPWAGRWSLEVPDAMLALWETARWHRGALAGRVVAVAGSVGKTSTREMIHAVLRTQLAGRASPLNFNNHVGLPLSLLRVRPADDYGVLELAASAAGQIRELAELARPHVAVVTRIADAHLGLFGGMDAIVRAKLEILEELPADGWAVLPGDDVRLRGAVSGCRANVLWYGRGGDCDFAAGQIEHRGGMLCFHVDGAPIRVPVWGRHHLGAALAALAVGRIFGLSDEDIAAGLENYQPPPQRCRVWRHDDLTVIDDSYNASPCAMQAALELLREMETPGRRVVVLGDMADLGREAQRLHRRLGEQVVSACGADLLLAVGEMAPVVILGACAAGMPAHAALACRDLDELVAALDHHLAAGDAVLVKGSRKMAMEQVVQQLQTRHKTPALKVA